MVHLASLPLLERIEIFVYDFETYDDQAQQLFIGFCKIFLCLVWNVISKTAND